MNTRWLRAGCSEQPHGTAPAAAPGRREPNLSFTVPSSCCQGLVSSVDLYHRRFMSTTVSRGVHAGAKLRRISGPARILATAARRSWRYSGDVSRGPVRRLVGSGIHGGENHVRVLMTGGYGCIGSWVAKQLADAGQEVWIYDLKEDTHRLDLILRAGTEVFGPFRGGRRIRPRLAPIGRRTGRGDSHPPPGGPANPHLQGQPALGREGQRARDAGGVRDGARAQGSGAAGRLRQLGGGARSARRRLGRPGRRPCPPRAAHSLRCVQGL